MQLVPEGFGGWTVGSGSAVNPVAARQKLAEAGYPDGSV